MNTEKSHSRQILQDFFTCLGEKGDTDALIGLLTDDIVADTPFAPVGQPVRFQGREAIRARFGNSREVLQSFEFQDIEILATEDPERWLVTCSSTGKHVDGRDYSNIYCWIFRIRGDRIAWWCEYYDPQKLMPFLDALTAG